MAISVYQATTTLSTTGTAVVVAVPGFQGKEAEIKLSGINGGESVFRMMLGWTDGVRQSCDTTFGDLSASIGHSEHFSTKMVSVWANVGGVATEIISASNPTFNGTQFMLDVATVDINYKISVKITA